MKGKLTYLIKFLRKIEQVMKVFKRLACVLMITLIILGIAGIWALWRWIMSDDKLSLPALSRLLPLALWKNRHPKHNTASKCLELPMQEDLHYAAPSWQLLEIAKGSMYLYAAYWDTRPNPQVTVLVYCDVVPLPQLYCMLWYENNTKPSTVLALFTYGWRPGGPIDGVNEPYLVSCKVEGNRRPDAVSLVTAFCLKSTNLLAVQGSREERGSRLPAAPSFGVCLKSMRYDKDISAILIEWIEILKAFGVDTIYIYVIKVHPTTERVLQHYSSQGMIDITPLTLPPQRRTGNLSYEGREFHDVRQKLLPLNDCLYRAVSSGKHQWLANIDLNEIIVPTRNITWQKLVEQESQIAIKKYGAVDAFAFLNYFFLDRAQRERAVPLPARILAHVWRAKNPSDPAKYSKCFYNVSSVIVAHNHFPKRCANECKWHVVPGTTARLQHYRALCPDGGHDCPEMHDLVHDDVLARLLPIAVHVRDLLRDLGIPFDNNP